MEQNLSRIAVIVSSLTEAYQNRILRGIRQYAESHPVTVCHFVASGGAIRNPLYDIGEYNIFSLPDFSRFDGVILLSNTIRQPDAEADVIARVQASGIPAVSVNFESSGFSASLHSDNYGAMCSMTEHLISVHGCKSFAFLAGPKDNTESVERAQGVKDTLAAHDLNIDPQFLFDGDFTEFSGTEAAKALLRVRENGSPLPDALICANDAMAIAAIETLERNDCKVPEDIRVTGFDHTRAARYFSPEVTTVHRHLCNTGYKACELLMESIADRSIPYRNVTMETQLIFTGSCGCKPQNPVDAETVKKANYRLLTKYKQGVRANNLMHCAFAECTTIEDIIACLRSFIKDISCDSLYFCLNDDWCGDAVSTQNYTGLAQAYRIEGYSKTMTIPLAYADSEFLEQPSFAASELLPEIWENHENSRCYYFFPLHFRDRCLGYLALCNSMLPLDSPSIHAWLLTLNTALENIRKIYCMNAVTTVLERLYVIDPLTGIYNRNGFARETRRLYEDAINKKLPVMVMFADLDGLKEINDGYGHGQGDSALRDIGTSLQKVCRNGEICCRFGGDEFLVFAVNATDEHGKALVDAFAAEMQRIRDEKDYPFSLNASIGYSIAVPDEDTTVFQMITLADQKMYQEKKKRKQSKYLRKDK